MGLSEADLFALDENAELSSAKTNSIVTTAPQKPYLSEIVDYDVDITPHQFIKIYSGVPQMCMIVVTGKDDYVQTAKNNGEWRGAVAELQKYA